MKVVPDIDITVTAAKSIANGFWEPHTLKEKVYTYNYLILIMFLCVKFLVRVDIYDS